MFGLVGAIDQPTSIEVVPRRTNSTDIAGNLGDSVSHSRHLQFRHSFHALKGRGRCQTDLIAIKMLWGQVGIVHRHSEKSSVRKNVPRLSPFDHRLEGGKYPVGCEGIRNPNIRGLPFGKVNQPHGKSRFLFLRAHGERIFLSREEFFANLALLDLAGFSKLTW